MKSYSVILKCQLKYMYKNMFEELLYLVRCENEIDKVTAILEQNSSHIYKANREDGWTLLHMCAAYGSPNMIKILIDFKADVNQFSDGYYTPALIAAKKDNLLCLKELIDLGADTKIVNSSNSNIISFLCDNHPELKYLLDEDCQEITFKIGELFFVVSYDEDISVEFDISVKSARNI